MTEARPAAVGARPRRRLRSWRVRAGLLVAVLVLLSLLGTSAWPSTFLSPADPAEVVDAVVVLAGDPEYERTDTAAAILGAGQARWLIVSGGYPGPGDSAASLRLHAIQRGVAPERIHAEEASLSTRECVVALRPVLARLNVRSAVVVTSPFHQRRAGMAARAAWPGVRVLDHPARSPWRHDGWWRDPRQRSIVLMEYGKLGYYGVRGWLQFRDGG